MCDKRNRRQILSSKHLLDSLKELVGKRLGCLCSNLDDCPGNVLIELVHEFFPSESEMRGYILCHQYLFFKGQSPHCQIVMFTILKCKMGHLLMFIRCMGGKKLLLWENNLRPRISWKQEILQRFSSY